jgi:outer membrane protein assembly factor BamB
MSVAWTRISTPSTNKPARSSGSLLPKVRWYPLRRWRAGSFIPAAADGTAYFGCRDSNVYAVDAKTGKQKWFYSTKGSQVNNSGAVYDGKVFFGTSIPDLLHAAGAKTGALSVGSILSSPVVVKDVV